MSDYISREAAIVDFERCNHENPVWTPQRVKTLLMRIPTADVEPVRHVRIRESEEQYVEDFGWFRWDYCLNCGSGFDITGHPRYCPYCGGKAVLESGPPIPVEHVEATEEEAEEFFQALESSPKPTVPKPCYANTVPVQQGRRIDKSTGAHSRRQSWCSGKRSVIGGINHIATAVAQKLIWRRRN